MKPRADSPRQRRSLAIRLAWCIVLTLGVGALFVVSAALLREPRDHVRTTATQQSAPPAGQSLLDQIPPDGGLVATRWPSAFVLTKSVTLETEPSPGFVRIHVPAAGATFETAFGVNPDRWLGLASGPFRFAVAVLTARGEGDRGERKLMLEEQIDPARELGDRKWFPVRIDLDRYAGQDLLLVLSVSTKNLVDAPGDLAGWADPRLVPHAAGTSAPAAS